MNQFRYLYELLKVMKQFTILSDLPTRIYEWEKLFQLPITCFTLLPSIIQLYSSIETFSYEYSIIIIVNIKYNNIRKKILA